MKYLCSAISCGKVINKIFEERSNGEALIKVKNFFEPKMSNKDIKHYYGNEIFDKLEKGNYSELNNKKVALKILSDLSNQNKESNSFPTITALLNIDTANLIFDEKTITY